MSTRVARAELLAAALLFSTGGTVMKALPLTSWQVAAGRSVIAALVMGLSGGAVWRAFSWRPVVVGVAQAATLVTFVTANKMTTAANAVFLQATAPLYVALLGPLLLREHLRRKDLPLLALILVGVPLLFAGSHQPLATAPHRVLGTIVGIASGFCWGLTLMGLRWLARTASPGNSNPALAAAISGNLLAFLLCAPASFPLPAPTAATLLGLTYLGAVQVGVAYLLLSRGLRHVSAGTASLLLLAEPAVSPLWAWLVHHEAPGFWPLVGGGLIVGAATAATWREPRSPAVE